MTTSADSPAVPTAFATINWPEADGRQSARWRSEAGVPPPKRIVLADHHTTADSAYRLAREGTALLWRGDFQNARQLLQAMTRRLERKPPERASSPLDAFILHRQAQSQRTRTHARTFGMLLIPLGADYTIPLRRAPNVQSACAKAYGAAGREASVVSLRELLGLKRSPFTVLL